MTNIMAIRSLALSVHFRQPKFGMRKYEILSRASAFLLAVDPPDNKSGATNTFSAYDHLKQREEESKLKDLRRNYKYEPAGGPSRDPKELGWLEFCPKENRPVAHVIASSHVLAPWKWKEYYPQDWISQVTQDNCSYSLDVICPNKPDEPLAKFALNPYPIHHPDGMDLSIIHLKNEDAALKHMKDLGVEILYLRNAEDAFSEGEAVYFSGFEITEDCATEQMDDEISFDKNNTKAQKDDIRVFSPYLASGSLLFFSPSRYLASTPSKDDPTLNSPLPQGLCGGPVLDTENQVCGVIEGVVPIDHPEPNLAGAAAFLPLHPLKNFVEWAEYFMLQQIVPAKLFQKIKDMKEGKDIYPTEHHASDETRDNLGSSASDASGMHDLRDTKLNEKSKEPLSASLTQTSPHFTQDEAEAVNKELQAVKEDLINRHSQDEVHAILSVVEDEKQEVLDMLKTEGGDIDDVVAKVRARTREKQLKMMKKFQAEREGILEVDDGVSKDK